ncbi:hypothetical protein [Rhodococcus sp. NPDC058521]|uniref:hypothetical protein n=1 Tax=Rhodococcus sp. NPDC058521 TaxID=3346536 RepID=UPI003650B531
MPLKSKASRSGSCLVAMTLSLATLITACGSDGNADEAATPPSGAAPSEVTVPISAAQVDVVSDGAEPREIVRHQPPVDATQDSILTTSSQVSQQIDGQPPQDFSSPELTLPLSVRVADADGSDQEAATDSRTIELVLGDADTPDGTLDGALSHSEGSGVDLTVGPNGAVTALRLQPAADAPDIARSAIEQAFYQAVYRALPFPETPIGVGAQWTVRQQVTSGITLDQTTTATLRAREGNRLTIDIAIDQKPQSDVWMLDGEAGSLNIDQYTMSGNGSMTVDLDKPLPVDGSVSVGGDQHYSDPDGTTRLMQSITNNVEWGTP